MCVCVCIAIPMLHIYIHVCVCRERERDLRRCSVKAGDGVLHLQIKRRGGFSTKSCLAVNPPQCQAPKNRGECTRLPSAPDL